MVYKIKLLPAVFKDLRKAKKWYQEINETLANGFKTQVNNEIDYIGKNPEHYQIKYKQLRQSLLPRFPFAIFYLVEEKQRLIVIIGILHTSRNPKIIKQRIKK